MTANEIDRSPVGTVGTIIHIGAGCCSELPQYLAANPTRIVLVEPQPDRARKLREKTAEHDEVAVIEATVAGPDAGDRLKVFNQSDYSSLREPTGLRDILPGLRTKRELEVDRLTPSELLERETLESGENHWLIIDAPGEEAAVIWELAVNENLTAFARIDLHCATTSQYEGNEPAESLIERLAENGQEVESIDEESDPSRPHWILRRNALKLENLALAERLAERDDQLAKAHKEQQQLKEKLDKRALERDEHKQTAEQAQARNEQLQAGLDAARIEAEEIRAAKQEAERGREQAEAECETAKKQRDKQQKQAEEYRKKLSQQAEEIVKLRESVERAENSLASERELRTRLDTEFTRAEAQLNLLVQLMTGNVNGEGGSPRNRLSSGDRFNSDDGDAPVEPGDSVRNPK